MKLTTPEIGLQDRQEIAIQLTETIVRMMSSPNTRGLSPDDLRARCTVHFTPYEPTAMAIGGKLMRDRLEKDVTLEFSDWNMSARLQRRLARELTPLLARLFGMESHQDHINIRFHSYPPKDFAVSGHLLSDLIPKVAQLMKRFGG